MNVQGDGSQPWNIKDLRADSVLSANVNNHMGIIRADIPSLSAAPTALPAPGHVPQQGGQLVGQPTAAHQGQYSYNSHQLSQQME